jgi:hypothetical protein
MTTPTHKYYDDIEALMPNTGSQPEEEKKDSKLPK